MTRYLLPTICGLVAAVAVATARPATQADALFHRDFALKSKAMSDSSITNTTAEWALAVVDINAATACYNANSDLLAEKMSWEAWVALGDLLSAASQAGQDGDAAYLTAQGVRAEADGFFADGNAEYTNVMYDAAIAKYNEADANYFKSVGAYNGTTTGFNVARVKYIDCQTFSQAALAIMESYLQESDGLSTK